MPIGLFARRLSVSAGAAIAVATAVAGCAGRAQAPEPYVEQYNRGQYGAARTSAESRMHQSAGQQRDQAALIAGLSAQASGQFADARRLLEPLASNPDAEIAGRAGAALGLISMEEGKKQQAASMLSSAARKLSGDESAKAAMHAGDALTGLKRKDAAVAEYRAALANARSAGLKSELAERLAGKRFTVQAGAFKSRENAQKRATEARTRSQGLGLVPRVIDEPSGQGTVYTVQIGEFVSRQEASAARKRLGVAEWVVAGIQP